MRKRLLKNLSLQRNLQWIVRYPLAIIMAVIVATLFFAWHIPQISIRTSIYDLVIEGIPETTRYERFKDVFGSDEFIRVVIKAKNVFDPVTFRKIQELSEAAAEIEGVSRVISLPNIKKDVDIGGESSLPEFAAIMAPVELFRKNLISEDQGTTALTLVLEDDFEKEMVIHKVEEMINEADKELSLYQIGMPVVSQALARYTESDFFRLPPYTFLLIALILLFLFRNLACLLLPLTCVLLSLIWTFGFMAWSNTPLSMLTMIVPIFLIAVGTAYCLHVGSEYLSSVRDAKSSDEAVFLTFSNMTFPTVLAVLTTVIGLGSLLVNRIVAIREFAIFSCFGMFSLMTLILTLFPAALTFFPLPERKEKNATRGPHLFERFLDWIVDLDLNYQKVTFPLLAIVIAVCLLGAFRIQIETSPIDYFKKDTPISRHFHDIYKDLSGSFPINLVMASKEADFFEDAEQISALARLQTFIETLPSVDKTVSFADYIKLVNYATNRFDPKYYAIPEEDFEVRMLISNFRIMLGEDMLSSFMSSDLAKANILVLSHIASSSDFLKTRDVILSHVRENFPKNLAWDITGLGTVVSASSQLLTMGQVKSLSLTIVLVFGIMFILFLSVKVGLVAIVPNLFPIVVNFGIMGWLGVELSIVTSLIASVAIGLAVDDTIHYLVRYNREFKKYLDDKLALRETIKQVGRPIVFTTLTISVGFSILAFSSFKPTAIFGVMMVITMVSALVGDLILLPSLMQHVELVTLWDLVRVKIGKDPHRGIPLFHGLSRTHVHYILAAGAIREFNAGEILFHKGDPSDFMYAVLSGTLDVVDPYEKDSDLPTEPGMRKFLNRMERGDLFGEMGLVRSAPRSATVIGNESGELLQINWKMIKRLQWLYPPAAQRFFFNIIAVVCDRLERSSDRLTTEICVDDLTGLCNKKGFVQFLERDFHRAIRYESKLSLCLMRVGFGTTNPKLRYDERDWLIKYLAEFFKKRVRKSDTLSRIDTHMFGLSLPHTSAPEAQQIIARLWEPLKQKSGENLRVRVAVGLVELSAEEDKTETDFLGRATKELFNEVESEKYHVLSIPKEPVDRVQGK